MKKVLLIALCVVLPMAGFAQKKKKKGAEPEPVPVVTLSDDECREKISIFQQNVKMDMFEDAYGPWLELYNARPDFGSQIYTNGTKIMAYRYEQAKDSALRIAIRDSIMKLHDDRIKYFDDAKYPDAYVLGLKGMDYLKYFDEDSLSLPAYQYLKEAVTTMGSKAQINMIRKFMEVSYNIFQSNTKQYSDQFLADHQMSTAALDEIIAANGKNAAAAQTQKAYVDRMFAASGAADCGKMDEMYAANVAANANNLEYLTSVMKIYRRQGCDESDVYFAAVESAHKLQPSAESAAGCAQICLKKDDKEGALEYYKQALSMVDNDDDKADYLYRVANICVQLKRYQQGASYAFDALKIDPENGRCYLLIGMCYGASGIRGGNWAAVDMFYKAKSVDASCTSAANKLISSYYSSFPTKETIFFDKNMNEGGSYFVGGWIGKSTIVRSCGR